MNIRSGVEVPTRYPRYVVYDRDDGEFHVGPRSNSVRFSL